jgi:hypothetical protein
VPGAASGGFDDGGLVLVVIEAELEHLPDPGELVVAVIGQRLTGPVTGHEHATAAGLYFIRRDASPPACPSGRMNT